MLPKRNIAAEHEQKLKGSGAGMGAQGLWRQIPESEFRERSVRERSRQLRSGRGLAAGAFLQRPVERDAGRGRRSTRIHRIHWQ